MNNRRTFLIITIILVVGLVAWWYLNLSRSTQTASSTATPTNKSSTPSGAANTTQVSPTVGGVYTNAQGQPEVKINPALPAATQGQMILDAQNSQLHDIYGKAIDQYGDPVAGAQAIATAVFTSWAGTRNEDRFSVTDAQGLFQFIGIAGWQVGFGVKKDGYLWNGQGNLTGDPQSNADHRVIFTMYKLQGAEPMVHSKFGAWIPYDGTSVGIDLFTGSKSSTGDLKVTLTRTPLQVTRGGPPFDWNVQIEVVGGGLVESNDLYPYEAPENGYQPVFFLNEAKDSPNWTRKLAQTFYVRTAKGDYGRITIDLTTDSDRPEGTGLGVESWMNPSGSRNLEPEQPKAAPAAQ